MGPSARSLTFFLSAAIAVGSVSYELCSAVNDEDGDAHGQLHSHGDYEHDHHHHHDDGADDGEHDDDHHGVDHVPVDLKAVWTTPRSRRTEAPPIVPPPAACVPVAIVPRQDGECRGIPPPRAGPDPTRQLRQIRSIVLLV
jgi:hypothetical protein